MHERLIVDGPIERLNGVLMHESIRDLEDALDKIDRYSTDGATMLHQQGRRARLTTAILRGGWTFLRTYLLRAGFLDGREGFMVAVYNAENTYYKYVKLMLLQQRADTPASQAAAAAHRDHPSRREPS